MKNNQLIKVNNNIFTKITNFFKTLFKKLNKNKSNESIENKIINKDSIKTINDKQEFLKLYENLKNGEEDIFSIDRDLLEKMCILLEEENKIKENQLKLKLEKISKLNERIEQVKNAV